MNNQHHTFDRGAATPVGRLPAELLAEFEAKASARDADRELPFDAINQLKAIRFGASRLPVTADGGGASLVDVFTQAHALAEADSNIAHIWRNHFMLIERLVVHPTDDAFLAGLRARVAAGDLIGLAGTELDRKQTGGASPLGSVLVKHGAGYRLSGRKFYSTGSLFSDWINTYAALEDGTTTGLVLPIDRKGIELIDDWNGMGQRLTGTGTTVFADVEVAPEEIIRKERLHPQGQFFSSTIAQLFLTTVIAGVVSAIAKDAGQLLESRGRTFYFAPAEVAKDDPILLASLGEREADAFAAKAIVLAAAAVLDEASAVITSGADATEATQAAAVAAAKAKVSVDAIALRAASGLFDIAGASATVRDKNLDRHWRNIRTVASHNPASYKALAVGARRLNGTPLPTLGFF